MSYDRALWQVRFNTNAPKVFQNFQAHVLVIEKYRKIKVNKLIIPSESPKDALSDDVQLIMKAGIQTRVSP